MKRKIAASTVRKWESPTFAEIRVSAEVTGYVAISDGGQPVDHDDKAPAGPASSP